jgi:hypothetical protein
MDAATSALHSKQYFWLIPGNSNNSSRLPQTRHPKPDGSSLPFGPQDMVILPELNLAGLAPALAQFIACLEYRAAASEILSPPLDFCKPEVCFHHRNSLRTLYKAIGTSKRMGE